MKPRNPFSQQGSSAAKVTVNQYGSESKPNGDNVEILEKITTLEEKIDVLQRTLLALSEHQPTSDMKDRTFSTKEAAQLLGKSPYTVREHCRNKRIRAIKIAYGRGPASANEWRIPFEELERTRNEGLRPIDDTD